jgi:hypothetical protein
MKVHLVRSKEVSLKLVGDVIDILRSVHGPISFCTNVENAINFLEDETEKKIVQEEDFNRKKFYSSEVDYLCLNKRDFPLERDTATWNSLFTKSEKYRIKNNIPANEFVFLLTDVANDKNWFSMLDERNPFNGFIHTDDWDYYLDANPAYPTAYEVIALVLRKHMFKTINDLTACIHDQPIGCINDFCEDKEEVILKLRTGDICYKCFQLIEHKINPVMLHQCLDLLESLRVRMLFSQNFRQQKPVSRLQITGSNRLLLVDYQNMEIKLRPLEKALYYLYLKHPEGIPLPHLVDYRDELRDIYSRLSTRGLLADIYNKVESLLNANSNSASEKISRIKAEFESKIGEKLSRPYLITGGNGEAKRIELNRDMAEWEGYVKTIH